MLSGYYGSIYSTFLGAPPPTPPLAQHFLTYYHFEQNAGLGKGQVGGFPETWNDVVLPVHRGSNPHLLRANCTVQTVAQESTAQ